MTGKVHIILPVHNRREVTAKFVACLKRQTHRDFHLILVDDGCTDGTADMVGAEIAPLTVIRGDGNLWWGGALQAAYEWLTTRSDCAEDLVLIINDDTVFEADFLAAGVAALKHLPGALVVAHCYSLQTGKILDLGIHVDWMRLSFEQASPERPVNCLSTRGLFMTVAVFLRTGGFRPRLLPHYASDYEFTIRARRKGLELVADPMLKVWLDEDTTGYRDAPVGSFWAVVRTLFSKKTLANPVKWFFFIVLCCPKRWVPLCLMRISWGTLLHLVLFRRESRGKA